MRIKKESLLLALCLPAVVLLLFMTGCTGKKGTCPDEEEPNEPLMVDYFPLEYGDCWTWEIVGYPVQEKFVDGDSSLGEPFTDLNANGRRDENEPYVDLYANGAYDGPEDPWVAGIPYLDRNANGRFDYPNSIWEEGEFFLDLDGNGIGNKADSVTFYASISYPYPEDGVFTRGGQFLGTYSNGEPGGMWGDVDKYSNDGLGLRWHGHVDRAFPFDYLADNCRPIVIARDNPEMGDSLTSSCPGPPSGTWISVFQGVEDVTVPAGVFQNCLKFMSIASGWRYGMVAYNGTSHQWYAKNVGLVKVEGPGEGAHWVLENASVGGRNYP